MEDEPKKLCGAKNRQGEPCRKPPMKGKTRCRMHGGATPKATKGNRTHGLYSAALSPAEAAMWDDISLDSLDEEIKMTKIWLARAGVLDYAVSLEPNATGNLTGFNLVEIRRSSDQNGSATDAISRRPDLSARQDRLLGRLAQLIKTRAELEAMKSQQGDPTIRFVIEAPREETVDEWQANYGPISPQEGV